MSRLRNPRRPARSRRDENHTHACTHTRTHTRMHTGRSNVFTRGVSPPPIRVAFQKRRSLPVTSNTNSVEGQTLQSGSSRSVTRRKEEGSNHCAVRGVLLRKSKPRSMRVQGCVAELCRLGARSFSISIPWTTGARPAVPDIYPRSPLRHAPEKKDTEYNMRGTATESTGETSRST